jgi:hypothetical protein
MQKRKGRDEILHMSLGWILISLRQLDRQTATEVPLDWNGPTQRPPDQGWNQRTSETVMRVLLVSNFHCFSLLLFLFLSITRLLGNSSATEYFIVCFMI